MSSSQHSFTFLILTSGCSGHYQVILSSLIPELIYPPNTSLALVLDSGSLLTLFNATSPHDFSTSCHKLASSSGVHECISPLCELYWEPGGGKRQQEEWWSAIWTYWAVPQRALYLLKRVSEATVGEPQSNMKPEVHCGLCTSVTALP